MENPALGCGSASTLVSGEVAALGAALREKTAELCARHYARSLRALVLTGSLARDEATWVREASGWRLLGDAEFLLVFESHAALPPQPALDSLEQEAQSALRREGILGRVQLVPVYPKFFRELQPHIFAHELRACGRVVWGDDSVRSLIPQFSPADIPFEDAWRLLANRMIEQLEAAAAIETCTGSVPERLQYCTVKLYLDMATSLLVFAGSYAPAYSERRRRLRLLADAAGTDADWPFPLGPFAQHVSAATDLKLNGEWRESVAAGWDFWRQGLQYCRLLWHWELVRLANRREAASDDELMRSWMHRQAFAHRLRGWIFVWRACGWRRSWRWWLRWARLAAGASPRYWVYDAAQTLFGQLPEVAEVAGERDVIPTVAERVLNSLPVPGRTPQGNEHWRWTDLAAAVASNYHRFLEPTRT